MTSKVDTSKPAAPAEDTAPAESLAIGDLVELHDGACALVVTADPVSVVRLGHPALYELPARKVS